MIHTESIKQRFMNFSINECAGSSELYELLSLNIAQDEELLELASHVQDGQPIPNMLFGAIHYLLLKETEHSLRDFYLSIVNNPKPYQDAFPYFQDFCALHREQIIPILEQHLVQTNEVRRCAYLYPIFSLIYEKTQKPLACIEIGTSAGLQL